MTRALALSPSLLGDLQTTTMSSSSTRRQILTHLKALPDQSYDYVKSIPRRYRQLKTFTKLLIWSALNSTQLVSFPPPSHSRPFPLFFLSL